MVHRTQSSLVTDNHVMFRRRIIHAGTVRELGVIQTVVRVKGGYENSKQFP